MRLGEYDIVNDLDCLHDDDQYCAEPVVDMPIASIHIHDKYTANSLHSPNDLALIRLKRKIARYTDFIRPICITDDIYAATYRSSLYTVNGWGFPEKGIYRTSAKRFQRSNFYNDFLVNLSDNR